MRVWRRHAELLHRESPLLTLTLQHRTKVRTQDDVEGDHDHDGDDAGDDHASDDDGDAGDDANDDNDTGWSGGAVLKFSTDRLHGTSLPRLSLTQTPQPQV